MLPRLCAMLLILSGCVATGGRPADPTTMRTLYEAQCAKGSSFACTQAAELRGDAAPIPVAAPAANLRLNQVGLRQVVQVQLNKKASLPFEPSPLAPESTIPLDIYESLRRFDIVGNADIIGRTDHRGPDGAPLPVIRIHELQVGPRTMADVPISVVETRGALVLGAPFFALFSAYTLNPRRHLLHLE